MRRIGWRFIVVLTVSGFILSCSNREPTTYERIVIDTFYPDGASFVDTYIDLFDNNGDPDVDYPWTDDVGESIASDDNGNTDQTFMSRIDYTGGLQSGTYYIRVRANVEATTGPYAIRVLSLLIGESLPAYALPGSLAPEPDADEDDDDQDSNWIMIKSILIQVGNANRLNRSIDYDLGNSKGDVDWFKLVLD
ncbi:hypothetical protein ES708_09550 [subsurface metagenome]